MRLTVGPLPPAVYWRRRVFVLAAVLLTLFLVAQACMAAAVDSEAGPEPSGSPGPPSVVPAASPEPATSPPDSSDPPADPDRDPVVAGDEEPVPDGDQCTDEEMLITAEASATTAPAGSVIKLTIRIQNGSDRVCNRDVGPGQREIYLRRGSGAERVWSSRDCVELSGSQVLELPQDFNTTHFVDWNGRASDSCEGPQPDGERLSPGEYELVARLGTVYSEPVTITLT